MQESQLGDLIAHSKDWNGYGVDLSNSRIYCPRDPTCLLRFGTTGPSLAPTYIYMHIIVSLITVAENVRLDPKGCNLPVAHSPLAETTTYLQRPCSGSGGSTPSQAQVHPEKEHGLKCPETARVLKPHASGCRVPTRVVFQTLSRQA